MSIGTWFNPSRLTLARKRRGLTMTRLAELIGVEPRSISAYEKGEFTPDPERRMFWPKVLRFPESFFGGDDLEQLSPDTASFRALSKMTAGERDMALGAGTIALLLNDWIEERFELPEASLPDLSRKGDPEAAARNDAAALEPWRAANQEHGPSARIPRRPGVLAGDRRRGSGCLLDVA